MMNEQKWLRRIVFLETVAGVPGMARPFTSRYSSHPAHTRTQPYLHFGMQACALPMSCCALKVLRAVLRCMGRKCSALRTDYLSLSQWPLISVLGLLHRGVLFLLDHCSMKSVPAETCLVCVWNKSGAC